MKQSIQIIIVLYKMRLENSLSYKTLMENIGNVQMDYHLLIYNNSPEIIVEQSSKYEIYTPENNTMLAGAYNFALTRARANSCEWLLLLDQDTKLTKHYFECLQKEFDSLQISENNKIAAFVPFIKAENGYIIDPYHYNPIWGCWYNLKKVKAGLHKECIIAINSCALINCSAIERIGGFPSEYPLDSLDSSYFYRFYKNGYLVVVLDTHLEHDMSIMDYRKNMTHQRYASIIESENKFAHELGCLAVIAFKSRLFLRAIKCIFVSNRRKYAWQTLKAIFTN